MAWHFLTFTSLSSKLEFVYPPCCRVEEQMLIFSSSLTPGRVKGSWIEMLTIVLIWKTPACPKFGKTSNRTVKVCHKANSESEQRTMHALTHRTSSCFYLSCSWRNRSGKKWRSALWLNAMHSGKKWWIREFIPPYIFLLNPDYFTARFLRALCSNN